MREFLQKIIKVYMKKYQLIRVSEEQIEEMLKRCYTSSRTVLYAYAMSDSFSEMAMILYHSNNNQKAIKALNWALEDLQKNVWIVLIEENKKDNISEPIKRKIGEIFYFAGIRNKMFLSDMLRLIKEAPDREILEKWCGIAEKESKTKCITRPKKRIAVRHLRGGLLKKGLI